MTPILFIEIDFESRTKPLIGNRPTFQISFLREPWNLLSDQAQTQENSKSCVGLPSGGPSRFLEVSI